VGVTIDSLNILPLLLGFVFFFQQKYMSPPPTPNMTPEQIQQQRIMKVMMVVLFPIFLYKAPSGLTLYIITSSCIGIMESKYVRAHIEQLDLKKPPDEGGTAAPLKKPPKKPKDPLARMWAEKLEAARQKRAEPPKTFKRRK
jgi:YidC/Oxa1 family membrane protein insertase